MKWLQQCSLAVAAAGRHVRVSKATAVLLLAPLLMLVLIPVSARAARVAL
jgi:hypothetical protein